MPSQRAQCGSTGAPHALSCSSISACDWWCGADGGHTTWYVQASSPRLRDERRIEVAHRAGGGVARIHEQRLARCFLLLVHPLEGLLRQVHLAADLDAARRAVLELQRDGADRPHVRGDVLAARAVAAGGAAHQPSVLVGERDAEAVDLELGDVGHRPCGVEAAPHALVERAQLLFVVGVVERQHRQQVLDGREPFGRAAADALRRRVGRDEIGMLGLERLQLAHQRVELGVGDLGRGVRRNRALRAGGSRDGAAAIRSAGVMDESAGLKAGPTTVAAGVELAT